jgi:hypothetical protein
MPKGVALTVLAAENFVPSDRDDEAFLFVAEGIYNQLEKKFHCPMPVMPGDDLLRRLQTPAKKQAVFRRLESLITDGRAALKPRIPKADAARLWQRNLGYRFPV